MWIRSQDKEMLMNCNAVGIGIEDDKSIYSNGYILGIYSTKEKALKVLDMIEKHIIEQNTIICNEKDWARYVGTINCVYQIPLDKEVEE